MNEMTALTPASALAGGALIGLSATLLLAYHGRIAGIGGILDASLAEPRKALSWRLPFLLGLIAAGAVIRALSPGAFGAPVVGLGGLLVAGLLVGVGTRLGNGCTSGHGVVGLSRLSRRSLVATVTFIAVGMVTTYLLHRVRGSV